MALKEVFADNPKAPPMIEGVGFALYFQHDDRKPHCRRVSKLTMEQKADYSKQALSMLVNGIIEFSDSDWAIVPVFAPKKDGGIRTALDCRYLNSLCVADSQPMPNLIDTLENLSRAAVVSTFDGAAGFGALKLIEHEAEGQEMCNIPCLHLRWLAPSAAHTDDVWFQRGNRGLPKDDEQDLWAVQTR